MTDRTPIFCDECSSFALAELDGSYLCAKCLLGAIGSDTRLLTADDVRPLPYGNIERPLYGMDVVGQTPPL